jgi:hypothetical protein
MGSGVCPLLRSLPIISTYKSLGQGIDNPDRDTNGNRIRPPREQGCDKGHREGSPFQLTSRTRSPVDIPRCERTHLLDRGEVSHCSDSQLVHR